MFIHECTYNASDFNQIFQRDIVKKIVLFFICATLGVSNAYGRDGRDIAAELSTASSVIYKTYKQGGITSVIGTISKCYAESDSLYFCTYLDLGGKWLDDNLGFRLTGDQNPFFLNQNISDRLIAAYKRTGIYDENSGEYSENIYRAMGILVSKRLTKKLK